MHEGLIRAGDGPLQGRPRPHQPPAASPTSLDLMVTVGSAVDAMITSSRRRLLAHLGVGHADEAGLEMEKHLRSLHCIWLLARWSLTPSPNEQLSPALWTTTSRCTSGTY